MYSLNRKVETRWGEGLLTADLYLGTALSNLVRPFTSEPGMSWANPEGTVWFTLTIEGNSAGICALSPMRKAGRCKSDVVLPMFRRGGVYELLSAARIEAAKSLGYTELSAFAGPMSIGQFLKDGFVQEGPLNKHGIAYMRKGLEA